MKSGMGNLHFTVLTVIADNIFGEQVLSIVIISKFHSVILPFYFIY